MTTELDTAALFTPTPANLGAAPARKCYRHEWQARPVPVPSGGYLVPNALRPSFGLPELPETEIACARCGKLRDDTARRRANRNKVNGRGTSRDLAAYLSGRNVELLGLKWDVEARGVRLQSKRDKLGAGSVRALGLILAIAESDDLRGLFHVAPGQRLASGTVTFLLREWIGEHGWTLPTTARLHHANGTPLVTMPLPTFRETHIGEPKP